MIQINKVVGATCLLALGGLGGCSSGLEYNIESADIAREANRCEGSTLWAKDVAKKPEYYKFHNYPAGTWKCNLYIADMLVRAGITPPGTNDEKSITSNGIWAIRAHQWQGDVRDFRRVNSKQPGDVISDGRHVAIVINDSKILGALRKDVNSDYSFGSSSTIQRYDG